MKPWIAVVAFAANRVTKYQDYDTQAEAQAHVVRNIGRFPSAFAFANPGGGDRDWRVSGTTLVLDPIPPPPPIDPRTTPLTPEDTERVLRIIGATRAQIDAAKQARGTPLP